MVIANFTMIYKSIIKATYFPMILNFQVYIQKYNGISKKNKLMARFNI